MEHPGESLSDCDGFGMTADIEEAERVDALSSPVKGSDMRASRLVRNFIYVHLIHNTKQNLAEYDKSRGYANQRYQQGPKEGVSKGILIYLRTISWQILNLTSH